MRWVGICFEALNGRMAPPLRTRGEDNRVFSDVQQPRACLRRHDTTVPVSRSIDFQTILAIFCFQVYLSSYLLI